MSSVRTSVGKPSLRAQIDFVILKHPLWTTQKVAEYLGIDYRSKRRYIWNRKCELRRKGLISEAEGRVHLAHADVHRIRLPTRIPPEWYDRLRERAVLPELGRPKPVKVWAMSRNRNRQLSFRSEYAKIEVWPTGRVSGFSSAVRGMSVDEAKRVVMDEIRLALFYGGAVTREEAESLDLQVDYVPEHIAVPVPIRTAPPNWRDETIKAMYGVSTGGDLSHPEHLEYFLDVPAWGRELMGAVLAIAKAQSEQSKILSGYTEQMKRHMDVLEKQADNMAKTTEATERLREVIEHLDQYLRGRVRE